MADQMDQISDAQAAIEEQKEQERTKVVCSYVYQHNGTWYSHTFEGTLSDCSEAFDQEITRQGIKLGKVPWARGHMSGRNIIIHPKNDATAEVEVRRVMATNPKPIPVDML